MKKRFIISLNSSTDEQDQELIKFIKDNHLGWWHWITNTWLISDARGKFTAKTLRTELRKIFPGVYLMVFELSEEGDTWAGFGPTAEDKNMFTWVKNNWNN